jgi:hypothetical protein
MCISPEGKTDHGDLLVSSDAEGKLHRLVEALQPKPGAGGHADCRRAVHRINEPESATAETMQLILLALDGRPRAIEFE